jgi:hypothetical protein
VKEERIVNPHLSDFLGDVSMAKFSNTIISGERVVLDGNDYTQCLFQNCEIVFGARGKVTLDHCTFDSCSFTFDGPAQDTLLFLTGLYGIGPAVVERTFDSIRSGALPIKPPPHASNGS